MACRAIEHCGEPFCGAVVTGLADRAVRRLATLGDASVSTNGARNLGRSHRGLRAIVTGGTDSSSSSSTKRVHILASLDCHTVINTLSTLEGIIVAISTGNFSSSSLRAIVAFSASVIEQIWVNVQTKV